MRDEEMEAFHEAGHAVVALKLGVSVTSIALDELFIIDWNKINPNAYYSKVEVHGACCIGSERLDRPEENVSILWGGIAAYRKFSGIKRSRAGIGGDNYSIHLLKEKHPDLNLTALKKRANKIIEQRWPAVRALAEALIEQRELNAEEVLTIYRDIIYF